MSIIAANLQAVRSRIAAALTAAGRASGAARLVAVSKTFSADSVREAVIAGQHVFGENYVQEGIEKIISLAEFPLEWHFIGPVQSNKARLIATHFSWVESVERVKIAQRLNEARPVSLEPLNVCIQVNISREPTKSGVLPEDVSELANEIVRLPGLRLRGLMAIPAPDANVARQRETFASVRRIFEQLNAEGFMLDTLSMGMSDDLEAAIAEGATSVRIGTAIFGNRNAFNRQT